MRFCKIAGIMHFCVRFNVTRSLFLYGSYNIFQFQPRIVICTTNKSVLCNLFCVMKLCGVVTVIRICVIHVISRGLLCILCIHYVIRRIIVYGNMLCKKVVFRNEKLLRMMKLYEAVAITWLVQFAHVPAQHYTAL